VPLEALADRALRALGHERTIATGWAGAGSFRELLRRSLPDEIKLTGDPPYLAFDPKRHQDERLARTSASSAKAEAGADAPSQSAPREPAPRAVWEAPPSAAERTGPQPGPDDDDTPPPAARQREADSPPVPLHRAAPAQPQAVLRPDAPLAPQRGALLPQGQAPAVQRVEAGLPQRLDPPSPIQQAIARIQEACQAPPLAPQEYRALFEIMASEINDQDLFGVQTLNNIARRAQERGIEVRRDDVRFVLEVVSEADPWFEEGASADLFASRFRNFVVARCRGQGLNLTADELDLIDAWFLGAGMAQRLTPSGGAVRATPALAGPQTAGAEGRDGRSWPPDDAQALEEAEAPPADDLLPRMARSRLRS
jgi:hypothetical protein